MFIDPLIDVEEEILLAPQHAGQSLPHYISLILALAVRRDRLIEGVCFAAAQFYDVIEVTEGSLVRSIQPQSKHSGRAGINGGMIISGGFGASVIGVDRILSSRYHEIVDAILDIG